MKSNKNLLETVQDDDTFVICSVLGSVYVANMKNDSYTEIDIFGGYNEIFDSFIHTNSSIIGFSLKDLIKILSKNGVISGVGDISENLYDIQIMNHLYNENDIFSMNEFGIEETIKGVYSNYEKLIEGMSEEQLSLYSRIEGRLIKVLALMELRGMFCNKKSLNAIRDMVDMDIIELGSKLQEMNNGSHLNVNSSAEVQKFLFEVLKIQVKDNWKTKGGAISTSEQVLNEIAVGNPDVKIITDYRHTLKIKTAFIDPIAGMIEGNAIHPEFNQIGALTGRMSCNKPNMQNQPTNSKYAVRGIFQAREGYSLIDADFSQIEIRILASISNDEKLLQAFKDGRDIHQETADRLGIERSQAKGINFGIIYGISGYGLAELINVSLDESKEMIKKYFDTYSSVKTFILSTKEFLRENGYVKTLYGRRRNFPNYNSCDPNEKPKIERQAINAVIQGTAADIMKYSLVLIQKNIAKFDAHILITIHDEVIVECKDSDIEEVKKIIMDSMVFPMKNIVDVPVEVNITVDKNWKK